MPKKKPLLDFSSKHPRYYLSKFNKWPRDNNIENGIFSVDDAELILKIEKKHKFSSGSLAPALHRLDAKWSSYIAAFNTHPNQIQRHHVLLEILSLTNELLRCIDKAGTQTKIELLANTTATTENGYRLINDLKQLEIECLKRTRKKPATGKKFDATGRAFLLFLMCLFEDNTANLPTITWNEYSESSYSGAFYDFLTDIFPLINKYFFGNKRKLSALAKMARTVSPEYKSLKSIR